MENERRQYPRYKFLSAKLFGILIMDNELKRVEIADISRQGLGIVYKEDDIAVPEWCRVIFYIPGMDRPVSVTCQTRYAHQHHIGLKILCDSQDVEKICDMLQRRDELYRHQGYAKI